METNNRDIPHISLDSQRPSDVTYRAKSPEVAFEDVRPSGDAEENYIDGKQEQFTPEELVQLDRIYRKLDLRIIPALWTLYFLTSFGDSAYGNALTMNLSQHHSIPQYLNVSTTQLSTANALHFVGYIIFDVPMNLVMTRVAPQSWMSRIVMSVGIVYAFYPLATSGPGLIVLRLMGGICTAGCWPGMAYYISMWYPTHRTARRIGYYFTAAQLSAAVAGLVAAGFQRIDGNHGLTGFEWMFLTYGVITIAVGFSLMWWLPDRKVRSKSVTNVYGDGEEKLTLFGRLKSIFSTAYPLTEEERILHSRDLAGRYSQPLAWGIKDLFKVFKDLRIWPLIMMYFGVVGTGFGLAIFASTIIHDINPGLSSIDLSLLTAPIWLFDLGAILIVTPLSDMFKRYRGQFFSLATLIIMAGLFITTFAKPKWTKWGGLLICGFGLGPTVPICMTWAAEIFGPRHGDLGVSASAALVSGLGNLGSVVTSYALYSGWPADHARGFRDSNMVMVAILGISIISAIVCRLVNPPKANSVGRV